MKYIFAALLSLFAATVTAVILSQLSIPASTNVYP